MFQMGVLKKNLPKYNFHKFISQRNIKIHFQAFPNYAA